VNLINFIKKGLTLLVLILALTLSMVSDDSTSRLLSSREGLDEDLHRQIYVALGKRVVDSPVV